MPTSTASSSNSVKDESMSNRNRAPQDEHSLIHATWIDLCLTSEVPENGGYYVTHQNHSLAVFRVPAQPTEGSLYPECAFSVIDDRCPHAGGSLSSGFVQDGCVVCPWHHWPFDIFTGACPDNPNIRVRTHRVRIANDRVQCLIEQE